MIGNAPGLHQKEVVDEIQRPRMRSGARYSDPGEDHECEQRQQVQRVNSCDASDQETTVGANPRRCRGVGIGNYETGKDEEHIHEQAIGTVPDGGNALVDVLEMEDEDAECGDETVEIENDEASWSTRFHVGAEFLRKRCLSVRTNCDASSQNAG